MYTCTKKAYLNTQEKDITILLAYLYLKNFRFTLKNILHKFGKLRKVFFKQIKIITNK